MKLATMKSFAKNPSQIVKAAFNKLVSMDRLHWMPDKSFLKLRYWSLTGKKLNLEDPKTLNEKLQWLKLYNRDPFYRKLVDKQDVKEYIAQTIGEEYLIPTLGVWDRFEDIDFDSLPQRFVLKCTHDSGSVVLCGDKDTFDIAAAREKLNDKLSKSLFWEGREWPYKGLKPRIIAEQYMENEDGSELVDYKFFCFGGDPEFVYVSQGLSDHHTARISYVSMDWKPEPFHRSDFMQFEEIPSKPKNFDKMVEFSRKLASDYPFVRVDFYEICGKLYFGEITFFPGSGYTEFKPDEWNLFWGKRLVLPKD